MTSKIKSMISSLISGPPRYYVIDGVIGAGKTYLLTVLHKKLEQMGYTVCSIAEPVDEWKSNGFLEAFYKNPEKMAYMFQTIVIAARLKHIQKSIQDADPKTNIFLLERSLWTDQLFMVTLDQMYSLNEIEKRAYKHVWTSFADTFKIPITSFIYVRPSLDVCVTRITKRDRKGESSIDKSYLKLLMDQHDAFFLGDQKWSDTKRIIHLKAKPSSKTTETTDLIVKPCEFRCILLNMSEDFTSDSPIVQKIADAVLSVK